MTSETQHTAWCKRLHGSLSAHGQWAVPRSGLIFRKTEKGLALDNVMPFSGDMAIAANYGKDVPPTPEELLAYQQQDFRCIQRHFKAADLQITDPKALL